MEHISKYRSVLMGFAALWIYYFHIVPAIGFSLPVLNRISCFVKDNGFCGVDIFLLLSGFGLVSSFQKQPVNSVKAYLRYLVRRLRRIWIVIVPVAVVIGLVDHWTILQFLGRCTGIMQLAVSVYDFLWFVPCILIFYLLAPFYYNLYRRAKHCLLAACLAMAAWIALLWFIRHHIRVDLYAIMHRVPVFLLGICFGELRSRGFRLRPWHYLVSLAFLLAGWQYNYALAQEWVPWYFSAQTALVNVVTAPGIVMLGSLLCAFFSRLRWVPLRKVLLIVKQILLFFGSVSLEFYAVQEWIWLKMTNSGTLLRLFGGSSFLQQAAAFCLSVLAAFLVHQLTKLIPSGKTKAAAGKSAG